MELRQYLNLAWKWLWVIVLSGVLAAGASWFASRGDTPIYQTRTRLMIGRATQNPDPNSMDLYTGQQLARTYVELVKGRPVLEGALLSLGIDQINWVELRSQVSAALVAETQLIDISVIDTDPLRAKALADAVAQQLILQSPTGASAKNPEQAAFNQAQLAELQQKILNAQDEIKRLNQELDVAQSALQIQDLQNQMNVLDGKVSGWQYTYTQLLATVEGGDVNTLSVVEEASMGWPIGPNTSRNILAAAAIGIAFATAGALLVEYLDDTIKDIDDVQRAANLPVLGAVARIEGESYPDKLIAQYHPLSPIVEAFRVLRTNLQYSSVDKEIHTLAVTSPSPSEGKSVLIANLAVVIAHSGIKVIIVDTDLRRPVQHHIFSVPNRYGLSDLVLHPNRPIAKFLQETGVENLLLLPSGSLPPNPAELLGSARMNAIVTDLQQLADIILFDSPPTLVVADAAILATQMDGVVLVCDSGKTRVNEAHRTIEELGRVRANILGVVLNRLSPKRNGYYYYHYYYSHNGRNGREPKPVPGISWQIGKRRIPKPQNDSKNAINLIQDELDCLKIEPPEQPDLPEKRNGATGKSPGPGDSRPSEYNDRIEKS